MRPTGGDNQLSNATRVIVYQIYYTAFRGLDYRYASAMSIVLFVIVLVVTRRKKIVTEGITSW